MVIIWSNNLWSLKSRIKTYCPPQEQIFKNIKKYGEGGHGESQSKLSE